jgi:copper homeostasis protein CutC
MVLHDREVDLHKTESLAKLAQGMGMNVTFHR